LGGISILGKVMIWSYK